MSTRRLPVLLDTHRVALSACRRCGHQDERVLPIISEALRPRVMLVGQAPGKSELDDRRAFTGRAGRTLFRWLERAGLDEPAFRREVYIAAITRCYPGPGASGRGDRVPSLEEQKLCAPWLDAEIDLIRPALMIPVGRLAIDRFLPNDPLDQLVGRVHVTRVRGRRTTLIPLPHPSGASSWVNAPANRALLEDALRHLRDAFLDLGLGAHSSDRARRSA
jgi:uracil-DNA glycosylase